jgi:hypothetical protein
VLSLPAHFLFFIAQLEPLDNQLRPLDRPTPVFLEISRYLCTLVRWPSCGGSVKLDINHIHPPPNPGCHGERTRRMGHGFSGYRAAETQVIVPEIVGRISVLGRFCNSARSPSGRNPRTHGFRPSHSLHSSTCPLPQFSGAAKTAACRRF